MFHALYTAASGMTAQQINLDNIANNLANASTAGFQSRRVQFSDLLYQSEIMPGAAATQQTTVAFGLAGRPGHAARQYRDHPDPGRSEQHRQSAGLRHPGHWLLPGASAQQSDRIHARGIVSAECSRESSLPRTATSFSRRSPFRRNATNITVGSDGTVSVTLPGQTNASQVGVIQLATFANPGGLNSVGNNIYLATTASGDPVVGTPGGADGLGTDPAGNAGAGEREHRRRVREHDPGSALV